MKPKSQKLDLEAAARLVRPRDSLLCGFVAGQPVGFLDALGARTDLEDVALYTGLLTQPFALLQNPGVRVVSGFFGPIERMARAAGARVSYLPADFSGLERRALRMKPRVALAVTSLPDREGWLSFGLHAGASYRPFLEAARDPERLAIAEVNPQMPRIEGVPELGGQSRAPLRGRCLGRAGDRARDSSGRAAVARRSRDRSPGLRADRARLHPPVRHRSHP